MSKTLLIEDGAASLLSEDDESLWESDDEARPSFSRKFGEMLDEADFDDLVDWLRKNDFLDADETPAALFGDEDGDDEEDDDEEGDYFGDDDDDDDEEDDDEQDSEEMYS